MFFFSFDVIPILVVCRISSTVSHLTQPNIILLRQSIPLRFEKGHRYQVRACEIPIQ